MTAELEMVARKRAYEERNRLGIGLLEPIDIFKLLRDRENISIIITALQGDMSGFFMRKNEQGLILINSKRTLGHQYFTAAHEYYHLKFDKGLSYKLCPITKYDDDYQNEKEANIFASYFLMPDDALRYQMDAKTGGSKVSLRDVIYLENYFNVSHSLMLLRLKLAKLLSDEEIEQMRRGIIKKSRTLGYDAGLYKDTADKGDIIYSNYAALAEELLEQQKISYGKYEELLMDGRYHDILFGDEEEVQDDDTDTSYLR